VARQLKTIAETASHLVGDWHPTKNGERTPYNTGRGSAKLIWWLCSNCSHEWEATPGNRTCKKPRGCPVCAGYTAGTATNLAVEYPELAKEWHPDNPLPPDSYRAHSAYEALWLCSFQQHAWRAAIYSRARGHGCPFCAGLRPTADTCLASTHPDIAAEWISCEIEGRTPHNTSAGSTLPVEWRCAVNPAHTWTTSVHSRTAGSGCLLCCNKIVTTQNCLATTHPQLAEEWSPENSLTAKEVVAGSTYVATWVCRTCSRQWEAKVYSRAAGTGCKACVSTTTSRQEESLRVALREHGFEVGHAGQLISAGGREWHCDIVDHARRLIVEFDGSYWHAGSERTDKSKSTHLRKAGWTVIRVREAPLEKLHDTDVVVPFRDDAAAARIVIEHLTGLGFGSETVPT